MDKKRQISFQCGTEQVWFINDLLHEFLNDKEILIENTRSAIRHCNWQNLVMGLFSCFSHICSNNKHSLVITNSWCRIKQAAFSK